MLLPLLGTAVLLAVGGALTWDRHRMAVATIEGELRRHHPRDVRVRLVWADADRDTLTYDVTYTDATGRRHSNRCKVSTSEDGTVYWERPLGSR